VERRRDLEDVVYGVHAVREALEAGDALRRLHVARECTRDPAVRTLLDKAREQGVSIRIEDRRFFDRFPYKAHQSVVAYGTPFDYATLEEVLAQRDGGPLLLVVLDHITDPHNAGAIIRTAECAGAAAVVLPERRSAGVNGTVRKAAAGATAHLPIARVVNVGAALRTLKKAGVWIAGADARGTPLTQTDLKGDLALVVGAEGKGLSEAARGQCDFLVQVPLLGKVGSLNASVAAGIILYEAVRQRR